MEQEELNAVIAENLAKYRKAANFTQLEIAEKLNYSDKSISKWEQGNGIPDVYVLYQMAELYGVTLNDLVNRHEGKVHAPNKHRRIFSRWMILIMSVGLCWLTAVVAFVFSNIIAPDFAQGWLAFIYALPVTFIVSLVFSCIWKFYFLRGLSASALIWTLLLAVCLTVNAVVESTNIFMLFLIAIPLQILVILWFVFRDRLHKKKQ